MFAAVGRHPNSATGFDGAAAADIEELAADERVRAIGETGLDYYRDSASPDDQHVAFIAQIGIARRTGLPLVIHLRDQPGTGDALGDTFATLAGSADGRDRDPPLLLGAAPGRIGEAIERGLVLLVRRQRHLSASG